MFSSHWCLKNVVWNVCLKYTANIDVLDREMCCAKKVETSVSSNKITAFCKNENNKQEVEKSPQLFNRQQLFNYGKNESLCGSNKMGWKGRSPTIDFETFVHLIAA